MKALLIIMLFSCTALRPAERPETLKSITVIKYDSWRVVNWEVDSISILSDKAAYVFINDMRIKVEGDTIIQRHRR
jgi:hypothetical protein